VICGQANNDNARTTTPTAAQNPRSGQMLLITEMTTMQASSNGIEKKMSLMRDRIESAMPP
jgi:hypothetical protein